VVFVRYPSPRPPESYSFSLTFTRSVPAVLVGLHSPVVGVSSRPIHVLTSRPWPSYTMRVMVPVGDCTRSCRPSSAYPYRVPLQLVFPVLVRVEVEFVEAMI